MSEQKIFKYPGNYTLESGEVLKGLTIAYHVYGSPNADKSNVVWACHALTANSDVVSWWPGLFGGNQLFNPAEHFMVCANVLGSHYGTTGPLHHNPDTSRPWFHLFPGITIRDMVKAHQLLAEHLDIERIKVLIGGSLGGQQALEWAIEEPQRIENLVLVATNARHSPWGIAFNESQRMAIKSDRTYYSLSPTGGREGLRAARAIALLSYRNYGAYNKTQADEPSEFQGNRAVSYQQYQGNKLVSRFNAFSYVALSKAMDSHNVGRSRPSIEAALQKIRARTLVIGIHTDILFPPAEQKFLASSIANAVYEEISSDFGHDGFLVETVALSSVIRRFLQLDKKEQDLPRIKARVTTYNYFNS